MNVSYYSQVGKGARKAWYYASNFCSYAVPDAVFRERLPRLLASVAPAEREEIERRVAYYNRMPACQPSRQWTQVGSFRFPFGRKKKLSAYFFDLYACLRHFSPDLRFAYEFGDVTTEPAEPTFVKSRPILQGTGSTSVLMKLNRLRHFHFVSDSIPFRDKRDTLISRNAVSQPQRRLLLEMYCGHPMCDVGQINADTAQGHPEWVKGYVTVGEQLKHKFISCIEGNDVASNLKWVMSSNSLAVMPRPRFETWFMEGTLVPDYHYVEIRPDYSDLIEKMEYYISHPQEAETIIEHAHEYVRQFTEERRERLISLLVARRYFERSGQM